jgi:hypothetical protein
MKFRALLILVVLSTALAAQDLKWERSMPWPGEEMEADNLGFLYSVQGSEVQKLDARGKLLSRYSDKSLGTISKLDVRNPMKILVFYRDFNTVVFLDNMLNPSGDRLVLENLGIQRAYDACASFDNGFWVFDSDALQLLRFTGNLEPVVRTGNLRSQLGGDFRVSRMWERENRLLVGCANGDVLVFDVFGTYMTTWHQDNRKTWWVQEDRSFSAQADSVFVRRFSDPMEQVFRIPDADWKACRVYRKTLWVLVGNTLKTYLFP